MHVLPNSARGSHIVLSGLTEYVIGLMLVYFCFSDAVFPDPT